MLSQGRQHTREDLQAQILFVAQAIRAALEDPTLVVESLDEAKRDLVLGLAVSGDAIPMTIDQLGELLVGFEPPPFQARAPVLEEAPGPALALVVPELAEGLLEHVGGVQPLVRREQDLQALPRCAGQILAMREQQVLLPLEVAPVFATEPSVLGLAHRVEGVAQRAEDVKLVEQDRRLRRIRRGRSAKRLPQVHHRQTNPRGLPLAQPLVELPHARFRAILAAKPDRSPPDQVAHHDARGVPFANRALVDADHLRPGRSGLGQVRRHVRLLQRLDRIPVQGQFFGNLLDRGRAAAFADGVSEPLGIEGGVGQKIERFALHRPAALARHPPDLEFQVDAAVATGQIAHAPGGAIVPSTVNPTTATAGCFFDRRTRSITHAFGSPKIPRIAGDGRQPGTAYASTSRRFRFAEVARLPGCQFRVH